MTIYIEVGKYNKKSEPTAFFAFITDGITGGIAHNKEIKSKKQKLKIAKALLELSYELEAEAREGEASHAG